MEFARDTLYVSDLDGTLLGNVVIRAFGIFF